MKLNLGCGTDIRDGFVNVDVREMPGVNLCHDLSLPLPYAPGTIDFIMAHDLIEHFEEHKAEVLLKDWIKCLKPGGQIELKTPDLDVLCTKIASNVPYRYNLIKMMFGGQDFPTNYHYWLYGKTELKNLLLRCGCRKIVKIWGTDLNHNMNILAEK